ncbi:MAG: peptidoglycan DD-metalloendopeptidase family protein [Vicinamibacteria bacterium]
MLLRLRPFAIVATLVLACAGAAAATPTGAGFGLGAARVKPGTVYFDGERTATARFSFTAQRRLDLVVRVVDTGDGRTVRRYVKHGLAPGRFHEIGWDGRRGDRGVPADGSYEFRIGPAGHRGAAIGRFEFHDHVFPVQGAHTYGDPFGDPRSGGRVHEGQDLPAACGTPLVAARGGKVAASGYSDALYGYYVLIDGLATDRDYFYAHLQAPTPLSEGDRVRTGGRIGEVGKTGNARNEFCQLHFELWPHGYHDGGPEDPVGFLRQWDAFS